MFVLYLLGFISWAVPTVAGVWYLVKFRELHAEVQLIRRYLQEMHQHQVRGR